MTTPTGCNEDEGGTSVGDTSVVGQDWGVGRTVGNCLVDSHVPTRWIGCCDGTIQIRSAEIHDKYIGGEEDNTAERMGVRKGSSITATSDQHG